jgi:outer membrane protein assembly factor BamB
MRTVLASVDSRAATSGYPNAVVSDGEKIYAVSPPALHAFRPDGATPEWSVVSAYSGVPAVANGVVYAISSGQLRAHDARTGAVKWTFAGDSTLQNQAIVAGRWVYVASYAKVYAFDTLSQTIAWEDSTGGWLSMAGGRLFVAGYATLTSYELTPPAP